MSVLGRMRARGAAAVAWRVALVLWVAFVWGHSLVPGPESDGESLLVVKWARPLFDAVGITDVGLMDHVVRKAAHFSEYAVLGALSVGAFRPRWRGSRVGIVPSLVVAGVVPSVDETIQLFVPLRSSQVSDVLLDVCGVAFGMLVAGAVARALATAGDRVPSSGKGS